MVRVGEGIGLRLPEGLSARVAEDADLANDRHGYVPEPPTIMVEKRFTR